MIRFPLIGFACLASCLHASEADDLLRFMNGDQLHGSFYGFGQGPSLLWKREDLSEPASFSIKDLRHLVLQGGQTNVSQHSISIVELINGDQIPGSIIALDDKEVTIDSHCAGKITLERNKVARIAPQPLGGRLHYHGPFSEKPWEVISYNWDKQEQEEEQIFEDLELPNGNALANPNANDIEKEEQKPTLDWQHSGAAWYLGSKQPGTALILRDIMPKRSTLRFDIAWKNRLNMAVAIHADFCLDKEPQENAGADGKQAERALFEQQDSSSLSAIFGNCIVLQIYSNYVIVSRCLVDNEGNKSIQRLKTHSNLLRMDDSLSSNFEIRSDLENSTYSLFVDGTFIVQWSDPGAELNGVEPLKGGSLAFMPQSANAQAKITDVIIAEWNGMPDSARSLQSEQQDVILMTNGLDRFAGKAISLEADQMLRFKGRHGEFLLPLDEISELHLATNDLAGAETPSKRQVKIRFRPMGVISGTLISGDRKTTTLNHQLAGDISIHHDHIVMLEFGDTKEPFTDWDEHF